MASPPCWVSAAWELPQNITHHPGMDDPALFPLKSNVAKAQQPRSSPSYAHGSTERQPCSQELPRSTPAKRQSFLEQHPPATGERGTWSVPCQESPSGPKQVDGICAQGGELGRSSC